MKYVRNSSDFECFLCASSLSVLCAFARNRLFFAKLKLTHYSTVRHCTPSNPETIEPNTPPTPP